MKARIAGTRIRVIDVVEKYVFLGYLQEEIAKAFNISLAEVRSHITMNVLRKLERI